MSLDYMRPLVMKAPANASVGVTSAEAVAADTNRRFIYIRNTSTGTQRISVGFGKTAVVDDGVTLQPNEWVAFDLMTGCPTSAVNAKSSAASGLLAIQEGT